MAFGGRLSLTPLPIDKDELSNVGELLADRDNGVLYLKLNDGSIVPAKSEAYFQMEDFFKSIWEVGDVEPQGEDNNNWIDTGTYDPNDDRMSASIKLKLEVEEEIDGVMQTVEKWVAISPHVLSQDVILDEEGNNLDDYLSGLNLTTLEDDINNLENESDIRYYDLLRSIYGEDSLNEEQILFLVNQYEEQNNTGTQYNTYGEIPNDHVILTSIESEAPKIVIENVRQDLQTQIDNLNLGDEDEEFAGEYIRGIEFEEQFLKIIKSVYTKETLNGQDFLRVVNAYQRQQGEPVYNTILDVPSDHPVGEMLYTDTPIQIMDRIQNSLEQRIDKLENELDLIKNELNI